MNSIQRFIPFGQEEVFGSKITSFQKLMRYKIRDILLVSSMYDFYLFEEDGRLYDLIRQEYQSLNLSHPPEITHVTTATEALELASESNFDLIITTLHIEDQHVVNFARKVRQTGINTPIVLLAYDNNERKEIINNFDTSIFERIFIWNGDYKLLIGIIKYVEDKMNVEGDVKTAGVQVILLVEDNVKFYSSYLPLLYAEIFKQSQRLISEGVNLTHKFLRMRARPKILLASNFEEAWEYYEKYQESILGMILDINFKMNGAKDPNAGVKLATKVREKHDDIPILLQSSNPDIAERAKEVGASFVQKGSQTLLFELGEFMKTRLGFGQFIFRTPNGDEIARASNLLELEEVLKTVPVECIVYHAQRNHFSNWLKARTEFWLAHKLRPKKVTDFSSPEELRKLLIDSLFSYRNSKQKGIITDFSKETFDPINSFARVGSGSLGGKARGLGFINILINNYGIREKFENIEISVPSAIVITTDIFDQFIEENQLFNFAMNCSDDIEITEKFLTSKNFSQEAISKLTEFLDIINEPLAVRSSSLLEDSQFQPFAGVYDTYMIPNNNPDKSVRLYELLEAIKCVYASTFHAKAKDYMRATTYRLEEEKMAVIVQRMVGAAHENRFYPDFAGVAKSYNFYPVHPQKATDGISLVALGLGKQVVDGGIAVRFCPKYPRHLLQFYSTQETIKNAQQSFFALDLNSKINRELHETPDVYVKKYEIEVAEQDKTLFYVGSTYSSENDVVYDGVSREGTRIVTFSPILKHKVFPLAEILDTLLELGSWGMGTPIEIEFAVNTLVDKGTPKEFSMLQMRPMVIDYELEEINVNGYLPDEILCETTQVLGVGSFRNIFDIVYVDINKFDRSKSREVAIEISMINTKLVTQKRPYLLIGVGRWGSLDNWLGIPVTWDQIAGANVIVESAFKDFNVTPSQGSHFFQNITSFKVGYFTINSFSKLGTIDWDWLQNQTPIEEYNYCRHLQFDKEIPIRVSRHQNRGIILKPGKD